MTARFADVLEISLAMSVVLAVLLALRPLLKKRLRAGAFYWVWLLAALRLCIPFNLSLPQAPVTVEAVPRAVYRVDTVNSNPGNHHYAALTEEEAASEEAAAENRPVDGGSIQDVYTPLFTLEGAVAALWLAGAGAFLAWHLAKYVRFRLRVRRWGAPAEDAALLARTKPRAVIINSSRGEVVDGEALKASGREWVLDVWEHEPHIDRELLGKALLATPHIAGYSEQGKANATALSVAALARRFGLPLAGWYPPQAAASSPRPIAWQELCDTVGGIYDIGAESRRLKAHPEDFEALRDGYAYRREYF